MAGQQILQEKWLKGVAVTTTILAVMTSIVSARSSTCTADTQLLTAKEAMKWQYFQAQSLKLQILEVQKAVLNRDMDAALEEAKRKDLFEHMKVINQDYFETGIRKDKIEAEAKELGGQKKVVARRGFNFTIAVVIFQIAIMLSSVSALIHRKELWLIGLMFGCVAAFFFANGFFLFCQLCGL